MRFHDFSLHYYGSFENETLSFPKKTHDLHIIYGLNEAGKSTLLNAFRDFLLGFKRHTQGEDWKYRNTSLIRLGATFSHNIHTQTAWRRRPSPKRGDLFENDDITPLHPSLLEQAHNGLTHEEFSNFWGLDHNRLRKGGETMANERHSAEKHSLARHIGDGSNISEILTTLEEEKKSLWAKKKTSADINKLSAEYRNKIKEQRQETTLPKRLKEARETLHDVNERYNALCSQCEEVRNESSKNLHLQDLISPYQAYQTSKRTFEARPQPLFNDYESEKISDLIKDKDDLALSLNQQRSVLKHYIQSLNALGERSTLLDEEHALTKCVHDAENYSENVIEFREKDKKYDYLSRKKADLITQLSLSENTPLTSPSQLDPLIALSKTYQQNATRLAERKEAVMRASAPIPLPEKPQTHIQHALESWMSDVSNYITLDKDYDELILIISEKERTITNSLKTLTPWERDFSSAYSHLHMLSPPSEEECQNIVSYLQQCENHVNDTSNTLFSLQHEYEENDQLYQKKKQDPVWVSEETLKKSRRDRNLLIESIDIKTISSSQWEMLKEHIHHSDHLADKRFRSAHIDAQLHDLQNKKDILALQITHARKDEKRAQHTLTEAQKRWEKRLINAKLPPLPPHQFTSWRQKRLTLLDEYALYYKTRDKKNYLAEKRKEFETRLRAIIPIKQDSSLTHLILESKRYSNELSNKKEQYDRTVQENTLTQNTLNTLTSRVKEAEQESETWQERWNKAARYAGYPLSLSVEQLPTYQELLTVAQDYHSAFIDKEKRDKKHYDHVQQRKQLLERYHAASLEALVKKLRVAKDTEKERSYLLEKKKETTLTLTQYEEKSASLHEQLAHFLTRLPEKSTMDDLLTYAQRDHDTVHCQKAYHDARDNLLSRGRGRSLSDITASVHTLDHYHLKEKLAELEKNKAHLEAEKETIQEARFEAQKALEALEKKDNASRIAEELQSLKARIEHAATDYVSLHAQHRFLQTMLHQQKEKLHGPFLALASSLFSRLTLGEYEKLDLEETKENTLTFVGFRPGNPEAILLEHMSEGTCDQLYLALRLADIHQKLDAGLSLPFFADDLFITFDDKRTKAGLEILAELSQRTQVFFFTHHRATLQHLPNDKAQVIPLSQLA